MTTIYRTVPPGDCEAFLVYGESPRHACVRADFLQFDLRLPFYCPRLVTEATLQEIQDYLSKGKSIL